MNVHSIILERTIRLGDLMLSTNCTSCLFDDLACSHFETKQLYYNIWKLKYYGVIFCCDILTENLMLLNC